MLSEKPDSSRTIDNQWTIGDVRPVLMSVENTIRYPLYPTARNNDWNVSLPAGGGLIRLGDNNEIFSISMFHQLRCLGIIHDDFVAFMRSNRIAKPRYLSEQCMDYLRQMVLCRANLRLESCRNPHGPRIAVSDITHTCKDWEKVFDAAEENYFAYKDGKINTHPGPWWQPLIDPHVSRK